MTQFWIAALALGLVAAAFVLVPVVARLDAAGGESSSTALGVGIVVALAVPVWPSCSIRAGRPGTG
jgi:cytochrome c-type biogenesis protein CcmH